MKVFSFEKVCNVGNTISQTTGPWRCGRRNVWGRRGVPAGVRSGKVLRTVRAGKFDEGIGEARWADDRTITEGIGGNC